MVTRNGPLDFEFRSEDHQQTNNLAGSHPLLPMDKVDQEQHERRQLRQEQLALLEKIQVNRDKLTDIGSDLLNDIRDANNQQFER